MQTFSRKPVYVALTALSCAICSNAEAVYVNSNGVGQVLLYPYYTVRTVGSEGYNTYLSVVNIQNTVKAVKVRFLEGKNARPVVDFNVYLSPYDMWTGALVSTDTGTRLLTTDRSCTVPVFSASGTSGTLAVDFSNNAYSSDAAGGSLDRTREGYIELIEMGNVAGSVAIAATHSTGGTPNSCEVVRAHDGSNMTPGSGGLFGSLTLINVNQGTDYTADALALSQFNTVSPLWSAGGDTSRPTLADVNPKVSVLLADMPNGSSRSYRSDWSGSANPVDAVSAVLMRDTLANEFVLDMAINAGTDWVVSFPTKRYYYNSAGTVSGLFQSNFTAAGACDNALLSIFDREKQGPGFLNTPLYQLCWAVTVANLRSVINSEVLGSTNRVLNIFTDSPPPSPVPHIVIPSVMQNGWVHASFPPIMMLPNSHQLTSGTTTITDLSSGGMTTQAQATYFGLPAIGFAVQRYVNGTLTVGGNRVLANYGGNFVHKYTVRVQ